ncbi:MAG: hypothetical protein UY76_C0001G0003 [Candidatus Uhrbacteria bacterium GW2011_GWA2_52_8d]|uniref:ATPase dynein-related AAA domain-containing protein n=1 Tax=Candidatus Uhrbacteria bacterium GW2011_GWA2_52_8d TaxID=1618979 RepID=A0A0G2ALF3_9BACT|nr:MAG: hypothetical protein UY76_C0001G0003 [Candidatus Uhrbacteria bacterium GW2011_GWA2_52_8d]
MPERTPSPESGDARVARQKETAPQERPRFDLSTLMGIKVEEVVVSPEDRAKADAMIAQLNKDKANPAQKAEIAWALRRKLRNDLAKVKVYTFRGSERHVNPSRTSLGRAKLLSKDPSHAVPLSVYHALLEDPQVATTLQTELARHEREKNDINGTYDEFKKLETNLSDERAKLNALLTKMFKQAGQDPDVMDLLERSVLESKVEDIEASLELVKKKSPDVAALIEYDTINEYARQLRENGFIWTKSRQKLLQEVLTGALTSRPVAAFLGETGTGKTAMARAVAIELSSREPERTVGGDQAKFERLFASPAISNGKNYYEYGPALRAMAGKTSSMDTDSGRGGGIWVDDEYNTRPTSVQRQILKFVSEAKAGRTVSVPGTPLTEKIQPGFLYLALGNPPSERYDREETGIETKREFAGNVLNVEYLEQTPDNPELYQVLLASLMDRKTGRLTAVTPEEVAPAWKKDAATGKSSLDTDSTYGAFLWRFSQAWGELFKAFSHKDTVLHKKHSGDPKAQWYLPSFILDPGVVLSWIDQYKASPKARKGHVSEFFLNKLATYLSQFPDEERATVEKYLIHFGIALSAPAASTPETTRLREIHQRETTKPTITVLTPKDIGFLNPNVPRPKEKAEPPKFNAVDLLDVNGDVVGQYVRESVLGVEPGGVVVKRARVTNPDVPQRVTVEGFAFDQTTKQADKTRVVVRDPDGNPFEYTLVDFRANFEREAPPTPETGELAPFNYDHVRAREYGFSEMKIEAHPKAQELIDAVHARDARFVTTHKVGDSDPDSTTNPKAILAADKHKLNEDALKAYWLAECSDLPDIPEKSFWYFKALADHRLTNTIDGDDPNNLANPTRPHIPDFGQKAFLLAMDFKEFNFDNADEKTAALTPQNKRILHTLFGIEDPTKISRNQLNQALWSDHEGRVQSDKAVAVIRELLLAGENPQDYELRLLRFDEYARLASSQDLGQKNLWTHFEGYYAHDGGRRLGLFGGRHDPGGVGVARVDCGLRDSRFGYLVFRLVLSRKTPETAPTPETANLQEARDILGVDNVYGPEAVKATWDRDLTSAEIPPVPYSREQLEGAKAMNMMLVLRLDKDIDGQPLTSKRIHEVIEPKLQATKKGKLLHNINWYAGEPFYVGATPNLEWKLVTRDVIDGSKNMDYTDQTRLLRDTLAAQPGLTQQEKDAIAEASDDMLARLKTEAESSDDTIWKRAAMKLAELQINANHRRRFVDVFFDHVTLLQSQGRRLFDGTRVYDWTSDSASVGSLVSAGDPDSDGMSVGEWGPGDSGGSLGVSLSR